MSRDIMGREESLGAQIGICPEIAWRTKLTHWSGGVWGPQDLCPHTLVCKYILLLNDPE